MMQFYLWDNFTNTSIMYIGRPYHDGVVGEIVPDFLYVLDEVLRVSVGHVDPDHKWVQIWLFDSKCYSTQILKRNVFPIK